MRKTFEQLLTEAKGGVVVFTFGRFNPPTIGHGKLIDRVLSVAKKKGGEARIYASQSQDKKKNPLTHAQKLKFMKMMFPHAKNNFMRDKKIRTPFEVLESLSEEGVKNVIFVVGSDRVKEFKSKMSDFIKRENLFDTFDVVSAGERDPDAEGVTGMSASKMRKAASENDFNSFRKGLPPTMSDKFAKELMDLIRKKMGIKESVQNENIQAIAY